MQMNSKVWLVKHPTWKYYKESKEEIRFLAIQHRLKVIDERNASRINPDFVEQDPPKLTLLSEKAEAPKASKPKAKKADKAEESPETDTDSAE